MAVLDDEVTTLPEPPSPGPDEASSSTVGRLRSRIRSARISAVSLLFYSAVAVLQFRDTWASPRGRWIGVDGDPPTQMWFLTWPPSALLAGDNPFYTSHLNYPDGVNLMWNTLMPLAGIVLAPVTWALGPVFAWNLLVTGGVVLSAWTACLLAHRYSRSWPASTVGGLVFGFSPYMMAHAFGHANLTFLALVPIVFLLIDELVVRQRHSARLTGAVLGVVLSAQLMIGAEILASMALCGAVAVAVLAALRPAEARDRLAYVMRGVVATGAVSLVLLAWPLWVLIYGHHRVRGGNIQPPGHYFTDLVELVRPTGLQRLAPSWSAEGALNFAPVGLEWNGYIGVPLFALVAWITWRLRSMLVVKVLAILAGSMTVFALGRELRVDGRHTGIPLPFRALEPLPVVGNMLSNRLMLYVYLCIGLLLAIFLGAVHASGSRWRVGAAYVVTLAAVLPLLPAQPHPSSEAAIPAFFEDDSQVERISPGAVAVVLPYTVGPASARPMLWQAATGMRYRMPSGYFVGADSEGRPKIGPTSHSVAMEVLGGFNDAQLEPAGGPDDVESIRAEFRRWGVEVVIVGPMRHWRQEAIALISDVVGASPEQTHDVSVWWDVDDALSHSTSQT